jgi:hypothetical protein
MLGQSPVMTIMAILAIDFFSAKQIRKLILMKVCG